MFIRLHAVLNIPYALTSGTARRACRALTTRRASSEAAHARRIARRFGAPNLPEIHGGDARAAANLGLLFEKQGRTAEEQEL